MQDARPSNATECGGKGDQGGLQQTETATEQASKTVRCTGTTVRPPATYVLTEPQVEMRKSADPYAYVWWPRTFLPLKKPSDMKRILSSTLTSLRRASGTLSVFTSDRPHTHTSDATMTAWGFHSSGFHELGLLGSDAVNGSRRFGNDLFIVRTQQYSAAVMRRQLLCHQCVTDNINSSLQARQFSSYESDGWFRLWALGQYSTARQYSLRWS